MINYETEDVLLHGFCRFPYFIVLLFLIAIRSITDSRKTFAGDGRAADAYTETFKQVIAYIMHNHYHYGMEYN